jgi:hypothetical protein
LKTALAYKYQEYPPASLSVIVVVPDVAVYVPISLASYALIVIEPTETALAFAVKVASCPAKPS